MSEDFGHGDNVFLFFLYQQGLYPFHQKKTLSTSKDSKIAYQLSVSDIIYYVLNNPSMFKHMYFGSGIDSETKSEYWHGALWGESPLFGENQITILEGNGIYLLYSIFCIFMIL